MEIVRFVFYSYHRLKRDVDTNHAVEKQYAVDVVMHLFMMIKAI